MATATYLNDYGKFWFQSRPRSNRGDHRYYDIWLQALGSYSPIGGVYRRGGHWRIEGDDESIFASRMAAAKEIMRRKSINAE
jgi:hypothetical protein